MIKLPKDIQIEEIPLEAMYRGVLRGLLTRIKVLYEAIYTRYGNDGLDLIREVSEKCGHDIAKKVRGNDEPWNIREVGLFLVKVFNNMRAEGEVTEFSENRVSIKVPGCPYPLMDIEICSAHTSMECALVQGLNPDLEYQIEKSVPAGDPFCLHVLTNDQKPKTS
jgi:predicted ArsR family transcriptional regulator